MHVALEFWKVDKQRRPVFRPPHVGGNRGWPDFLKIGERLEWQAPNGTWLAAYLQRKPERDMRALREDPLIVQAVSIKINACTSLCPHL